MLLQIDTDNLCYFCLRGAAMAVGIDTTTMSTEQQLLKALREKADAP